MLMDPSICQGPGCWCNRTAPAPVESCEHDGCTEPAVVEVEHYACGVRVATTRCCAAHRYHCREASVVLSHVERAL